MTRLLYCGGVTEPFPPGCPPADAKPLEGSFFRLAERRLAVGQLTGPASWLRPYETRNGGLWKQSHLPEAHALSVYSDVVELKAARDISPLMGRKPIAKVVIATQDGWVKHAPTEGGRSHHDWWTNPYDLTPRAVVVEAGRE